MAPLPPRTSGSVSYPSVRLPSAATPEGVRFRVVARMPEKLDPVRLRRMPESIMRQEVRRVIEGLIDAENSRLGRPERDALVEELVGEALGYGPLDELFRDPTAKEVLVLNPQAVLVRREAGWGPTNVKFRDAEHLRQVLEKALGHAEAVGGERLPPSAVDARLSNGFRAVGVVPPAVLELPPTVTFIREEKGPFSAGSSGTVPQSALSRAGAAGTPSPRLSPSLGRPLQLPNSGPVNTSVPRPAATESPNATDGDPMARVRSRITARILSKLASLGVSDLYRVEAAELLRAISAYVAEYAEAEKGRLNGDDQARLAQEILTALRP